MQVQSANSPSDNSSTLASVPETLSRWAEESRAVDGDSIYDCIAGIFLFIFLLLFLSNKRQVIPIKNCIYIFYFIYFLYV